MKKLKWFKKLKQKRMHDLKWFSNQTVMSKRKKRSTCCSVTRTLTPSVLFR
ncbi:hypothetical protein HID58_012155, partial [Brassica napus]